MIDKGRLENCAAQLKIISQESWEIPLSHGNHGIF